MVVELCLQRTFGDRGRSRNFGCRWLVEWCLILGICNIVICGYIEIVEQQGCHDNRFRLTCPSLDTHLAILEATFTPANSTDDSESYLDSNFSSPCSISFSQLSYPHTASEKYIFPKKIVAEDRSTERNLRGPISHRCSGVNHCSFILNLDHEESLTWGPGFVYIKYACMDGSRVTKYCNEEVPVGEGFVQTPGYPRYYVGDGACRWLLRAPRGQAVRLSVLDLSLRSIGPYEDECVDRLSIRDGRSGRELLSTCDQVEQPLVLVSEGETLDILVKTNSKKMFPKRGILLHYKALGCVTPAAPRDGYLVYRDGGRAKYMCCVGHAFPDTSGRERSLRCMRDNTWNDSLPDCIKISSKIWAGNGTFVVDNTSNHSNKNSSNMIVDVVIPSLIIAALFIGNAFIVLIIFKYRKRKDLEMGEHEEFNLTREVSGKNGRAKYDCNEDMTDAV